MTYVTCTRHPEGRESGIIATMEVEALWKWKHDGSGKWKYCEVVVDGPNEPPYNTVYILTQAIVFESTFSKLVQ